MATTSVKTPSGGDQPENRNSYVCPQCKTRISYGTHTTPPANKCPTCHRRLWIPTVTPTLKPPAWMRLSTEQNPYQSPREPIDRRDGFEPMPLWYYVFVAIGVIAVIGWLYALFMPG